MQSWLWTPDLAVGVGEIDRQHQELFLRFEELLRAIEGGAGKAAVLPMLDFLARYTTEHFAAEAAQMKTHAYPRAVFHNTQHRIFLLDLNLLRADYEKFGETSALALALQQRLLGWLRDHVRTVDLELGRFLAAKASPAPRP